MFTQTCPRCGHLKYDDAPVCHKCLKEDLKKAIDTLKEIIEVSPTPVLPYGKIIVGIAINALAELEAE